MTTDKAILFVILAAAFLTLVIFLTRIRRVVVDVPKKLEALLPESRYLEIDKIKIHYLQAGRGQDVVLLHGIGASVYIWRFIFPLLAKHYRVTAFDLPGFGKSHKGIQRNYGLDAQSVVMTNAIQSLGLSRPLIVGSSMGGAIALWMAKLEPKLFTKIVALAPASDSRRVPASLQHFAAASPLLRRTLNRRTMKLLLKRLVHKQALITDEVVEAYLEPFTDQGDSIKAFWSAMGLLSDRRLPRELKAVIAEVLVIYGERDLLVSRRSIDRLMTILPHAELILHKDGGHHIMEDEPEWLADRVAEFFRA